MMINVIKNSAKHYCISLTILLLDYDFYHRSRKYPMKAIVYCNLLLTFAIMTKEKTAIRQRTGTGYDEPKHYKVIIYNDDFTTMEFVVTILVRVFGKTNDEAQAMMLDVHNNGKAVAGIYSLDIAVSKATIATSMARERNFPLRLEVERE